MSDINLPEFKKKLVSLYTQRQKESSLRWIQSHLKILPYVVPKEKQESVERLLESDRFANVLNTTLDTHATSPTPEDILRDVRCIMQEKSEAVRQRKYGVNKGEMLLQVPNVLGQVRCVFYRLDNDCTCDFEINRRYVPKGDDDPMQYFAVELAEFLRDHGWGSFSNGISPTEEERNQALDRSVPSITEMIDYIQTWNDIFSLAWPDLFREALKRGQSHWNDHVRVVSASFDSSR
jgi:hypothetical protein